MATRHPKSGKGRPWTIRELQSIPESWEGDTISDGGGLSGKVRVGSDGGVSIRFQYAFRWENRITWAANDPKAFWRAAFRYERQNGSVCRVYDIALPNNLSVEQNVDLSDRFIRALASDKPYQGELLNVSRGTYVNRSLHLRLTISERLDDGIERPPAQTFKRYDAAHPVRGGRRKDGCGKSKIEMGNELKQTRRMLTEIQERALLEARSHETPRFQFAGYSPDQRNRERLYAIAGNQPEDSRYGNIPGSVVYCVS